MTKTLILVIFVFLLLLLMFLLFCFVVAAPKLLKLSYSDLYDGMRNLVHMSRLVLWSLM